MWDHHPSYLDMNIPLSAPMCAQSWIESIFKAPQCLGWPHWNKWVWLLYQVKFSNRCNSHPKGSWKRGGLLNSYKEPKVLVPVQCRIILISYIHTIRKILEFSILGGQNCWRITKMPPSTFDMVLSWFVSVGNLFCEFLFYELSFGHSAN